MTRRSALLGLLAAAGLGGVYFYNLYVLRNTNLGGSYLPVGVFGAAILFAAILNPLLRRLGGARARWSAAEIAGAVTMGFFACGVVGAALLDHATTLMMMPYHLERTLPGWHGDPARPDARSVRDWRALARAMGGDGTEPGVRGALARRVPDELRTRLNTADIAVDTATRESLLKALHASLADARFADEAGLEPRPPLPLYAQRWLRRPPELRAWEQIVGLNRAVLDAALPEAVVTRRPNVLDLAPPAMLADPSADPAALDGYITGLRLGSRFFSPREVPWRAWRRPLLFWGPLIVAMFAVLIGLSLVLHRQWSHHERLPYPTVEILRSMLPAEGEAVGAVFRCRPFWIGFGAVFLLYGLNYANVWWPEVVIPCPLTLNFRPLLEIFPLMRGHFPGQLFQPTLYLSAVGLAYFLSTDVAFSLGAGPYMYSLFAGLMARLGYTLGAGFLQLNAQNQMHAGAYTALFLTLLYSGRHYFGSVARGALGLRARGEADVAAVWGARVVGAGFVAMIVLLTSVGVEPLMALLWVAVSVMVFTVLSRLLAEAGVFYMHPVCYPCVLLWSFLGTRAVGYEQLVLLGLGTAMFVSDPKDALMPFVVTALHFGERSGVRPATVARWGAVAALVALLVGTPAMLYFQYRHGAIATGHPWMWQSVPAGAFDRAAEMTQALQAQGALGEAHAIAGLDRFREAAPRPALALAFGVPFGLVLLFTSLRHRFARWPLHPLMFLVMSTYQSSLMAFSFLLGWAFKGIVMKYGGARVYQRLKPLVIGIVAGEILAAALPLLVGALYSAVTGRPAPAFRILPG